MTPTPEQLAMARMIYADYLISKTPGATQDDAPQFDDSAHGVQIALTAIIEATERATKFLLSEAVERAKDECIRDAEAITECASAPVKEISSMTTDNDALVRTMAERFLSWKLPENFNPDGGIKFDRVVNLGTPHQYYHEPTGTNLLDFTQAKQMIKYLLAGLDLTVAQPKPLDPPAQDEVEAATKAIKSCALALVYPDVHEHWTDMATAAITALRQHQSADLGGWIVGNSEQTKWRTWGYLGPEWTDDRNAATRYARREDAEAVHREDEDAWSVVPYGPVSAEVDAFEAGIALASAAYRVTHPETEALRAENARLRELVGKAQAELRHAAIFVRTREKMHSDGVVLYDELLAALAEKL